MATTPAKRRKPPKWNTDRPDQAYRLALLGANEPQMCQIMGVHISTFEYWKRTKPEFLERLNAGRMDADARVAEALFNRAVGYDAPDTHISVHRNFNPETKRWETEVIRTPIVKHYPPNAFAAHKWLTIRQRELWADIQRSEHTTNINFNLSVPNMDDISTEELQMMKRLSVRLFNAKALQPHDTN